MVRKGRLWVWVTLSVAVGWTACWYWSAIQSGEGREWSAGEDMPGVLRHSCVTARACFGPECQDALVDAIDDSTNEVLVAIYTLTRRTVTSALARAARRGVRIEVRYDAKSAGEVPDMSEAIAFLKRQRVKCVAVGSGDSRARMHHKFMVIDRRFVLTGSYNYTTAATQQNRENLVIIEAPLLAAAFAGEFGSLLPASVGGDFDSHGGG